MTGKAEKKRVTKKPKDSGRKGVCVVRKEREVFERRREVKAEKKGK